MCIYFIQAEQGGLIKIGYAKNPIDRLYQMQPACPIPLIILATIKGGSQSQEREIHDMFNRDRKRGEWFEPSLELMDFIQHKAEAFNPPPTPEFSELDYVTVAGKVFKRCKGYSVTTGERCKSHDSLGNGYCSRHKP